MKRYLAALLAMILVSAATTAVYEHAASHAPTVPPMRLGARSNIANNELQNTAISPLVANDLYNKLVDHDSSLDTLEAKMATVTNGAEILASGSTTGTPTSLLNISGTKAYTLANGTYPGQTKYIEVITAGSTPAGTLTVTTPLGTEPTSYLLDTVSQTLVFKWQAASSAPTTYGWHLIGKVRAGQLGATAVPASGAWVTAAEMHYGLNATVDGTKSASFADGQVVGELVHVYVSAATNTPSGTLTGHYRTKLGVAANTSISAVDATSDFGIFRWDGANWCEVNSTGLTYN